jgi:hypothetical protein
VRGLELAKGLIEVGTGFAVRDATCLLDLGAETKLHLAGRLLGEGDGDQGLERGLAGPEKREDALDQRRRLAGACGSLHDERDVEIVRDAIARGGVDEGGSGGRHFCLRSATRSFRRSPGLRFVRISS